jgi:hypothetical protein
MNLFPETSVLALAMAVAIVIEWPSVRKFTSLELHFYIEVRILDDL